MIRDPYFWLSAAAQNAASQSVTVQAGFSAGLRKAAFSASSDYQQLFAGGQTGTNAYVGTTATCTSYTAEWNQFSFSPNFTDNFLNAVAGLGTTVSFLAFATAFGECTFCAIGFFFCTPAP